MCPSRFLVLFVRAMTPGLLIRKVQDTYQWIVMRQMVSELCMIFKFHYLICFESSGTDRSEPNLLLEGDKEADGGEN